MNGCTKCGKNLEDGVLFCPGCGTKQYLPVPDKSHSGELLVKIPKCSLSLLGFIPVECTLYVYDNRLTLLGNNGKNLMDLGLPLVSSVHITRQTLAVKNQKEKVYQITFPTEEADFLPYVLNLILDYRQSCFYAGGSAPTGEQTGSAEMWNGAGTMLWMKEKPVQAQDSTKGTIKAEKLFVAKTGHPFRFAGQIYQDFRQLFMQVNGQNFWDVYGRCGSCALQRFPIFDSADALYENRYWRYFYLEDRGMLHLVVFQDEWMNGTYWKSDSVIVDMEIFENVQRAGA